MFSVCWVDGYRRIIFEVVRSPCMISAICIFAISDPMRAMRAPTKDNKRISISKFLMQKMTLGHSVFDQGIDILPLILHYGFVHFLFSTPWQKMSNTAPFYPLHTDDAFGGIHHSYSWYINARPIIGQILRIVDGAVSGTHRRHLRRALASPATLAFVIDTSKEGCRYFL